MNKAIAISVLLVAVLIAWTIKFIWLPESDSTYSADATEAVERSRSKTIPERSISYPLDENNYPEAQRVYVPADITFGQYFGFLDSLAAIRDEFRGLNLPGDRLIVLANTWILDSLTSQIVMEDPKQRIIIPARTRLNIPDRTTARSLMQTMRQSVLRLDTAKRLLTIRYDSDTLFCTSATFHGSFHEKIMSDTGRVMVAASHRRTRFPGIQPILLPCLEIIASDQKTHLLIGSGSEPGSNHPSNLIRVAPADIWIIHYLAPPGTPFRID